MKKQQFELMQQIFFKKYWTSLKSFCVNRRSKKICQKFFERRHWSRRCLDVVSSVSFLYIVNDVSMSHGIIPNFYKRLINESSYRQSKSNAWHQEQSLTEKQSLPLSAACIRDLNQFPLYARESILWQLLYMLNRSLQPIMNNKKYF